MSRKPAYYSLGSIIFVVGAGFVATPAPAADYYAGKSVDMIVGNYPGGGFDIYARAVARHLGRNIPGNPTIVVKNMPGAGSAKAGYQVEHHRAQGRLEHRCHHAGRHHRAAARRQAGHHFRSVEGHLSRHRQCRRAHLRNLHNVEDQALRRCAEQQDAAGRRIAWRRRARLRLSPQAHHQRPDRGRCGLQGHARSRARYGARRDRWRLRLGLVERQGAEAGLDQATASSTFWRNSARPKMRS